jgi:hypothetical protein
VLTNRAKKRSDFAWSKLTFVVEAVDGRGLDFAPSRDGRAASRIPMRLLGYIAGRTPWHGRAAEHLSREIGLRSRTGMGTQAVIGTATEALPTGARVVAPAGWKAVTQ